MRPTAPSSSAFSQFHHRHSLSQRDQDSSSPSSEFASPTKISPYSRYHNNSNAMYSPGQQIEEPSRVSPESHVNHVRTNFVGRGYQPPATATAGQYSPPRTLPAGKDVHAQAWRPQTHTSTQRLQAPMIVEHEVDMDSEMPFDQERDQSPSTTSGRQVDQPTPRLFNPMCPAMNAYQPEQEQSRVATVATRFEQHYSSPARHRVDRFDEFGSSPNSSPQRTATAANHRANRLSYNQPPSQPGDDDSLFDFQEGQDPVRKLSKAKNHHQSSKQRRTLIVGSVPEDEEEQVVHDDEDSIEELPYGARAAPSPVNLQERTQQAWKVRKGKTSVLRTKSKSPTNDRAQMGVSFGKSDTVHHFEPEEQELTNDDETATLGSFEDRSLNSMYTKSMESEVEDVLKDVLLIGTESHSRPGRRKVKHKYEVKKKLRQQANKTGTLSRSCQGETVPEDDDEETFEIAAEEEKAPQEDVAAVASYRVNRSTKQKSTSKNESSSKKTLAKEISSNKQKSAQKSSSLEAEKRRKAAERRKKAENDDPFVIMWGYLDSGIKAVSEALGMEEEEAEKPKRKSKKNSIVAKKSTDRQAEPAAQVSSAKDELRVVEAPDDELQFSDKLASRKSEEESAEDTVNYQQEMLYDSNGRSRSASLDEEQDLQNDFTQSYSASMDGEQEVQAEEKAGEEVQIGESVFDPTAVEEDDPRIVELAIYAAKSLHTSRDVQYDDSIPIDMFEDIQLSVVELKLPLGLIFLENDGGCFVTKVSPDGSAARSGGVELGDQLAAINGVSCVRVTVDDICNLIAGIQQSSNIELVFVRYTGPLRPLKKTKQQTKGAVSQKKSLKQSISRQGQSKANTSRNAKSEPEKQKKGLGRWFGKKKDSGKKR